MQEQQAYQPNVELVFRLLKDVLDEGGSVLKLYFTLSTGAVVLFINLLVQSRASRLVSVPLALSIFAFGAEAVLCLRLLLGLVRFRQILVDAISTGEAVDALKSKLDNWARRLKKYGQWLERLFWAGMAFAAIFVAAIVLGR